MISALPFCLPAGTLSGRSHDSKAQDPRIYRSYGAQICAPLCSKKKKTLTSCALCSASLRPLCLSRGCCLRVTDQADLGLSRTASPPLRARAPLSHANTKTAEALLDGVGSDGWPTQRESTDASSNTTESVYATAWH